MGRKCFECKEFYEEKIHNHAEVQVSTDEYKAFLKELELFDDWMLEMRNREIEIAGTIDGVKPHFVKKVYPKASFLSFRGYILTFREIYIGRVHLEDYAYARISDQLYQKLQVGAGDEIEARARVKLDHGRLILYALKAIEPVKRGEPAIWSDQKVQLAREVSTEFTIQPEECVQCPFGALIDVEYMKDHHSSPRRQLMCLKGIRDYRDCYVKAEYCGLENDADSGPQEACGQSYKAYYPR
ncbi:MAG: hypothetical protein P8184_04480 [Calditrichia bacterium]